MKIEKVRCPLKDECGAKVCDFEYRERECSYYFGNARDGMSLEDQEMPLNYDFDELSDAEEKGELTWIAIDKLFPHPDNPRKELGDLEELAESIKAKGILQNLTVVPYRSKTNPKFSGDGLYTVIIGHRRRAAAELAGLTEVPCVITDMTEREQIQTMMLENMQRSDLTIYEQAQGFQMMLDLGETRESISATTGFSRSTVDRRIKLLNIDGKKFKSAEERGATLEDYLQVAEIEDKETRDKLTDAMGTNNFRWMLTQAIEDQVKKQKIPLMRADMKRLGVREDKTINTWDSDWQRVLFVEYKDYESGCADDKVSDAENMRWNESRGFSLFKPAPKKKKVEIKKSDEEIRAIELREKLKLVTAKSYESRKEFVLNFSAAKKYEKEINDWAMELHRLDLCGYYFNKDIALICEAAEEEFRSSMYFVPIETIRKIEEKKGANAKVILLAAATASSAAAYYYANYGENQPQHQENKALDVLYDNLCAIGYQMSDEEKELRDGTHIYFAEKAGQE